MWPLGAHVATGRLELMLPPTAAGERVLEQPQFRLHSGSTDLCGAGDSGPGFFSLSGFGFSPAPDLPRATARGFYSQARCLSTLDPVKSQLMATTDGSSILSQISWPPVPHLLVPLVAYSQVVRTLPLP